jgi:N-methylhydantoinase B
VSQAAVEPHSIDPITVEVLRHRLGAIAQDAGNAVERTAISPIITEAKDYAVGIFDAAGNLVAGAGSHVAHWPAQSHGIRAVIERYGDDVRPGDVFLANDPHMGGGLHPGDVLVQQPVYAGERRVAWAAIAAHMMDMGGLAPGTFFPNATDCYQEGLRLPPVRLLRGGHELSDVWDIVRNNVRLAPMVEMDIRSLVAGTNVVHTQVGALAAEMGSDEFVTNVDNINLLTEREVRRRIAMIADGQYRATTWIEFGDRFFRIPCVLTVDGETLDFDFDGAPPQQALYVNTREHVVAAIVMTWIQGELAGDLPFAAGLMAPVRVRCPEGSMLNARPPAPINSSNFFAGLASAAAKDCLHRAIQASPDHPAREWLYGGGVSVTGSSWGWMLDGRPDTWIIGTMYWGNAGSLGRDGCDLSFIPRSAHEFPAVMTDIEIQEAWYPVLVHAQDWGSAGAGHGRWRSGTGIRIQFAPHGVDRLVGQMTGMQSRLPSLGEAGGLPGLPPRHFLYRRDGTVRQVWASEADIVVEPGDRFESETAKAGGYGDPLDRDLDAVHEDLRRGRLTVAEAADGYGVVCDSNGAPEPDASVVRRDARRRDRLARANAPMRRLSREDVAGLWEGQPELPLYADVVQRGAVAFARSSDTPLAIAPGHWTDGCAVLEEPFAPSGGMATLRIYLDPATGRSLYAEVVPNGEPRSFATLPARWTAYTTAAAASA